MINYYMMKDFMNPKPVLDENDLWGKARKAYLTLHTPGKVDHRKLKWAKRYLKAHGYTFVSEKEAEHLNKEWEDKNKLSELVTVSTTVVSTAILNEISRRTRVIVLSAEATIENRKLIKRLVKIVGKQGERIKVLEEKTAEKS